MQIQFDAYPTSLCSVTFMTARTPVYILYARGPIVPQQISSFITNKLMMRTGRQSVAVCVAMIYRHLCCPKQNNGGEILDGQIDKSLLILCHCFGIVVPMWLCDVMVHAFTLSCTCAKCQHTSPDFTLHHFIQFKSQR